MKDYFENDTIAAVSTPVGKSGIGIVRLSGKNAVGIADKIFVASGGKRPAQISSHTLQYGWVVNNSQKGPAGDCERIDEVLLSVMRAPKTYTREDIVEINCHSGIVVLKRILDLVIKMGARLAAPGEFTKRAYLNGRIDLSQAEAVLDVINSKTKDALNAALGQLRGGLSQKVKALRKNLLDILAQLEASIDFSDQDIQPESLQGLLEKLDKVSRDLKELLDTADKGAVLREGITCAICGRPNVGKSSLLNALLKRERAIVTPIPGTTRDVLEETLDLFGIPVRLIDTAGIIKGHNIAEKEAVKRSKKWVREASIVLLVLDGSQKLTAQDQKVSRYVSQKCAFVLLNKQDLLTRVSLDKAEKLLPGRPILRISALRGTGLDRLERQLADSIWEGKASSNGEILVTNLRHAQALQRARKYVLRSIKAIKEGRGAEIVALEIKEAKSALGQIIGEIRCEDILEQIFSQFCIGK